MGTEAGLGLLITTFLTGKACAEAPALSQSEQNFPGKASLPLPPGRRPTPDFIPLVCGAPARLRQLPNRLAVTWQLTSPLAVTQRRSHCMWVVGPASGLFPLSRVSVPSPSPNQSLLCESAAPCPGPPTQGIGTLSWHLTLQEQAADECWGQRAEASWASGSS